MHIIRMILSLGLCNAFEPQPKSVLRQRTEQTTCQERSRSCKALPAAARSGHGAGSRIEMSFAFVYRCCQLLSVCCSKNVPKSLQDFQIVEQTRGDPDIGEQPRGWSWIGRGRNLGACAAERQAQRNGLDLAWSGECMLNLAAPLVEGTLGTASPETNRE